MSRHRCEYRHYCYRYLPGSNRAVRAGRLRCTHPAEEGSSFCKDHGYWDTELIRDLGFDGKPVKHTFHRSLVSPTPEGQST